MRKDEKSSTPSFASSRAQGRHCLPCGGVWRGSQRVYSGVACCRTFPPKRENLRIVEAWRRPPIGESSRETHSSTRPDSEGFIRKGGGCGVRTSTARQHALKPALFLSTKPFDSRSGRQTAKREKMRSIPHAPRVKRETRITRQRRRNDERRRCGPA